MDPIHSHAFPFHQCWCRKSRCYLGTADSQQGSSKLNLTACTSNRSVICTSGVWHVAKHSFRLARVLVTLCMSPSFAYMLHPQLDAWPNTSQRPSKHQDLAGLAASANRAARTLPSSWTGSLPHASIVEADWFVSYLLMTRCVENQGPGSFLCIRHSAFLPFLGVL